MREREKKREGKKEIVEQRPFVYFKCDHSQPARATSRRASLRLRLFGELLSSKRERNSEGKAKEKSGKSTRLLKKGDESVSLEDSFTSSSFLFQGAKTGGASTRLPPFFSASCAPLPQAPPPGGARSRAGRNGIDDCLCLRLSTQSRSQRSTFLAVARPSSSPPPPRPQPRRKRQPRPPRGRRPRALLRALRNSAP